VIISLLRRRVPILPSLDYGILQGAVTLLVGLLIFHTLGLRLSVLEFSQQKGSDPIKVKLNRHGVLFIIMLVCPWFTIGLSLFEETIDIAKIFFIMILSGSSEMIESPAFDPVLLLWKLQLHLQFLNVDNIWHVSDGPAKQISLSIIINFCIHRINEIEYNLFWYRSYVLWKFDH
jgi:hypothetical protein